MTTPSPDQIREQIQRGQRAQQLRDDAAFSEFVRDTRQEILTDLLGITGHTPEADGRRLALVHQLAGIESLGQTLRAAMTQAHRAQVSSGEGPQDPQAQQLRQVRRP